MTGVYVAGGCRAMRSITTRAGGDDQRHQLIRLFRPTSGMKAAISTSIARSGRQPRGEHQDHQRQRAPGTTRIYLPFSDGGPSSLAHSRKWMPPVAIAHRRQVVDKVSASIPPSRATVITAPRYWAVLLSMLKGSPAVVSGLFVVEQPPSFDGTVKYVAPCARSGQPAHC